MKYEQDTYGNIQLLILLSYSRKTSELLMLCSYRISAFSSFKKIF